MLMRPSGRPCRPEVHYGRPAKATCRLARRAQQDPAACRPVRGGIEQRVDHRCAQRRPRPYRTTCENRSVRLRRATVPRTQPSPGQSYSTVLPTKAGPFATSAGVGSRKPAGAMNILVHGGVIPPPPLAVWRGVRLPPGRWRRLPLRRAECAPTQRGWRRAAPARVRRDRGERRAPADSLGPGRPSTPRGRRCPLIRVATAGPSGCVRRAGAPRRSGSPRSRRVSGRASCSDAGSS